MIYKSMRVFVSFLLLLIIFLFIQADDAVSGGYCCDAGYSYDLINNNCVAGPSIDSNEAQIKPIKCGENEYCRENGYFSTCQEGEKPEEVSDYEKAKKECEDIGGIWQSQPSPLGPLSYYCQFPIKTGEDCPPGFTKKPSGMSGETCIKDFSKPVPPITAEECEITQQVAFGKVVKVPGVQTALGCIPYDPGILVKWFLGFGLSLAGGIAFLLITWGAFLFITSQGNPDQLQRAKETIVSAVGGLLFLIFAVFLLRLIGVDILKIPGFL